MAVVTARYRGFISDNHQGGSGKPYEDSVSFEIDEESEIYTIFGRADSEIKKRTNKLARLSMCNNDNAYQLISVTVSE